MTMCCNMNEYIHKLQYSPPTSSSALPACSQAQPRAWNSPWHDALGSPARWWFAVLPAKRTCGWRGAAQHDPAGCGAPWGAVKKAATQTASQRRSGRAETCGGQWQQQSEQTLLRVCGCRESECCHGWGGLSKNEISFGGPW